MPQIKCAQAERALASGLIEKRMLAKDPGDRFQRPAEALIPCFRSAEPETVNRLSGRDSLFEHTAQVPRVDAQAQPRQQAWADSLKVNYVPRQHES